MALSQLLNVPIHSWPASDSFRYIRDFLACRDGIGNFTLSGPNPGPGYELVDEYYVADQNPLKDGDWCVFKSNGEANSYPHYLKLTFGANAHRMDACMHWDSSTHTAWGSANGASNSVNHGNYQGVLSIHADLDECHIITQYLASSTVRNVWQSFGRLKPDHTLYDGTAVQVESNILASANRIISLPSWPGWANVGKRIYNWDNSGIHVLTITGINEATRTITVSTAYDKSSGSWLAEDFCVFAQGNATVDAFTSSASQTSVTAVPARASSGSPTAFSCRRFPSYVGSIIDGHYDHRLGGDIWVGNASNARGRYSLAKETSNIGNSNIPNNHGIAWVDEDTGQAWRSYVCHDSRWIAFKEAI